MANQQPTTDPKANVNVTLDKPAFPCPLCGKQLDVRQSQSNKPYCVCESCGVQLFIRGKAGISRLRKLLDERERLVGGPVIPAVVVFDRIEQLRTQKRELQEKRPLIFSDDDLEHTIAAVDREIDRLQAILRDLSGESKS